MIFPEERYDKLETKQLPNGKIVYKSCRTKKITYSEFNGKKIKGGNNQRLDNVAFREYGDASQWWRIASANDNVKGSIYSKPGSTILIPKK